MAKTSILGLFAGLALAASGCGETMKTTSTNAATSTPATATAPATTGSQPPVQSTGSTGAQPAGETSRPNTTETATHPNPVPKKAPKAAKPSVKTGTTPTPRFRYPKRLRLAFVNACEGAKGSPSACECVITKQTLAKVEKGQAIAEVLALEAALTQHIPLAQAARPGGAPEGVQRNLKLCLHSSA
jgi:hypothetical protein